MTARAAMAAVSSICVPTLAFCIAVGHGRSAQSVIPDGDQTYTSTRQITCLALSADGEVWAGTNGGILRRTLDGKWHRIGRLDGLPSNEVKTILFEGGTVIVEFPTQSAIWSNGRWIAGAVPLRPSAERDSIARVSVNWRGQSCSASFAGLRIGEGKNGGTIPLPPSNGTHVGGVTNWGDRLLVGMYGDGLWEFDGRAWTRSATAIPAGAREITALAAEGAKLWVGTRRAGVWEFDGRDWRQNRLPDEPFNHNAQALAMFRGDLYMSTLEDGLCIKTVDGWTQIAAPTLSSNSPRQMVEFLDRFYVRHGNGMVDAFDGKRWEKNVCALLARKEVSALATDGNRLYAAVWGGWSEFDGRSWAHHFPKELAGTPTTAVMVHKNTLWIGTQGRGLGEVDLDTRVVKFHDERNGMPDDWVTCIGRIGDRVFAGTFVGGLAWRDTGIWKAVPELSGENVTAIEMDGRGGLFAATRKGVWHGGPDIRLVKINDRVRWLDDEAQCLCTNEGGLWLGARTGLFFLSPKTINAG